MIKWRVVQEFPRYSVSELGQIRNDETDRILQFGVNQFGIPNVGLSRLGVQHKRSVTLLVARAFVHQPREAFNTPINLDGNKLNNHASNIVWRPRWFALKYTQQFFYEPAGIRRPIIEVKTQERFRNSWEAATKYGLLDLEILDATINRTFVWPTFQTFEIVRQSRIDMTTQA